MENNIVKGNIDFINTEFVESELPLQFCDFEGAGGSCRGVQRRVDSNKSDTGYEDVRYTRYSIRIPEDAKKYCGVKANFYYKGFGGIYIVNKKYIDERSAHEKYKKLFEFMDKAYQICFTDEIPMQEYLEMLKDKDKIKKNIHRDNLKLKRGFIEKQNKSLRCIYDYGVDIEDYGNFITGLRKLSNKRDLISDKYELVYFEPNRDTIIKIKEHVQSILGETGPCSFGNGYSFIEEDKPKAISLISIENRNEEIYYVALLSINRIGEPTMLEGKMLLDIDKVDIIKIAECPDKYKNIIARLADYNNLYIADELGLKHGNDTSKLYTNMEDISPDTYKIRFNIGGN